MLILKWSKNVCRSAALTDPGTSLFFSQFSVLSLWKSRRQFNSTSEEKVDLLSFANIVNVKLFLLRPAVWLTCCCRCGPDDWYLWGRYCRAFRVFTYDYCLVFSVLSEYCVVQLVFSPKKVLTNLSLVTTKPGCESSHSEIMKKWSEDLVLPRGRLLVSPVVPPTQQHVCLYITNIVIRLSWSPSCFADDELDRFEQINMGKK